MSGLTPMQSRCLVALDEMTVRGVPPTMDAVRQRLGLSSKSGVGRLYNALEERGYIRRHYHRSRSVEIIRRPKTLVRIPAPAELQLADTPTLLTLLAHICGILGHRLGAAKVRETLDRIGAGLAGVRG